MTLVTYVGLSSLAVRLERRLERLTYEQRGINLQNRVYVLDTSEGQWAHVSDRPKRDDGSYLERLDTDSPKCSLETAYSAPLTDVIRCVGFIYLFSDRTHGKLLSLRAPPLTTWIPVHVTSAHQSGSYWALTCRDRFYALDRDRSDFEWLLPGKVMGAVKRWILDPVRLPPYDFFMADNGRWLVRESFVQLFDDAARPGAVFVECEIDGQQ